MEKTQNRTELRLCVLHSSRKSGGYQAQWHEHTFYELGVVLEGTCEWQLQGHPSRQLSVGQMILIPPGWPHREEAECQVKLGWLGFHPSEKIPDRETLRIVSPAEAALDFRYLLRHLYVEQSQKGFGSPEICALTLEHLLLLYRRSAQKRSATPELHHPALNSRQIQIVQSLATHLERNADQSLSLEQLARYYHLSAPHLSVLFQSYYQTTPTRYRQRCRLERARELLEGSSQSVKEVASACGFTDAAHFCKEFKKQTGQTPSEARNIGIFRRRM